MRPTQQQLIELRLNLEVVTKILAARSEEVATVMFELFDSDEAYSAAYWPPEIRAERFAEAAVRLQITDTQLRLLSAILGSIP